MTAILGYTRVGTIGQDPVTRFTALADAGVNTDRIFTDKLSGSASSTRPGPAWCH